MDLKKIILEELNRLDEMAAGTYRSNEDQAVLDELMKRDDWEIILNQERLRGRPSKGTGIGDIANLTPDQKRVLRNYKTYLYKTNPLNKEKIKQHNLRYRQSEKGKETLKKFSGTSIHQTEEEKKAAREKRNHLQKMYSKKRPLVIARIKKYQKAYKSDPIHKERRKMLDSDPIKREKWNRARRERRLLKKQQNLDDSGMMSFATWMENIQNFSNHLNFKKNPNEVLAAFKEMEGEWVLENDGPYTVKGAIEWLKKNSENNEGDFIVYGAGGVNRYFVYANGDIVFSEYHAKHPQEKTIKKAQEVGFKTE